jgi:hypothetical protein
MAFVHSKSSTFSIDDSGGTPRDISAYVNNVQFNPSASTADVTALSDTSKAFIAGLKDCTISIEISWDATVDEYLWGILGAAAGTFSYSPDGGTTTYSGECFCTSYTPASAVDNSVKGSATFQVTGTVSRA